VDNAQFNDFQVHQRILAICHLPHLDRLRTADFAIEFGNKTSQVDIESLCENMRQRMAISEQRCSFYFHLIELLVHLRIISIRFESCYARSSTGYLPMQFG
jgi:hypothetical protein